MNKTVAIALSLILAIGGAVWHYRYRLHLSSPAADNARREKKILRDDRANPGDRAGALIRLGNRRDAEAKETALEILRNPEKSPKTLAIAAIRTVGLFEEPLTLATLGTLLDSPDDLFRINALQALGSQKSAAREALLLKFVQRPAAPGTKENEHLAAFQALFMTSNSPERKKFAVDEILKVVQDPRSSPVSAQAVGNLISMAPQDERVIRISKGVLLDAKSSKILTLMALSHLAHAPETAQWLAPHFGKFLSGPDRDVRLTCLRVLHQVCPADHYGILANTVKAEKDPQILATLSQEFTKFSTPESVKILEKEISTRSQNDPQAAALRALAERIKAHLGTDPCHHLKAQK